MIDRGHGLTHLCRVFGSVVPRATPWGIIGGALGYFLDASDYQLFKYRNGPNGSSALELWHHPYSVHVFGMVIGFALVIRVQIAYQRFWEGATNLRTMSSKLADAVMQLVAFDETPGNLAPGSGEVQPAVFDERGIEFRLQTIHFASLFHALTLIEIRGDGQVLGAHELSVNTGDPYLFRVEALSKGPRNKRASVTLMTSGSGRASGRPSGRASPVETTRQGMPPVPLEQIPPEPNDADPAVAAARRPSAAERLPSVLTASLPCGWRPGKPVPLQQVIRARRLMGEGGDNNSIVYYGEASQQSAVQPRSIWRVAGDASMRAGSFWKSSDPASEYSRRRSPIGVSDKKDDDSTVRQLTISSTGNGGRAHAGAASCCEYLNVVLLARHSKHALAKLAAANKFDVVGGLSEAEKEQLASIPEADRAYICMTWMTRLMSLRLRQGGLAVAPPLLSRVYQSLSDAMHGSQQAVKLATTPFPYPITQLLALMLLAFTILVPMAVAAFVDSPPLVATLSFFICLSYNALNEAARELEHPFGLGANHLPTVAAQESFNSKVSRLLDLSHPELGYVPLQTELFTHGASPNPGYNPVRISDSGSDTPPSAESDQGSPDTNHGVFFALSSISTRK